MIVAGRIRTVLCKKLEIFLDATRELVFTYTEDMEPEIVDCGGYFEVYYFWNPGADRDDLECVSCSYSSAEYYYVAEVEDGEVKKVG